MEPAGAGFRLQRTGAGLGLLSSRSSSTGRAFDLVRGTTICNHQSRKARNDAREDRGRQRMTFADQSGWTKERFGGWAPGMYSCRCNECHTEYMGDKRSFQCYPCAKKFADDAIANNVGAGI